MTNQSKVDAEDYIQFLIATQKVCSATEAARCQPQMPLRAAHDSFTRLLQRLEPDAATLWQESKSLLQLDSGVLIVDDSTLDKPYAQKIPLVTRHWSGKHHKVVQGINLITLLWSDGVACVPCDYRIYELSTDQLTKNDHFRAMLDAAKARGFVPECVLFDSWYSSLDNLKQVVTHGWTFLTRLKSNRQINPDRTHNRAVSEVEIGAGGRVVHLKGFGMVRVFRTVATDGEAEYWCTNKRDMTECERQVYAKQSWKIEEYHRGLKQHTGAELCQMRSTRKQRNHIGCAIRAFVRLEWQRLKHGISWAESKLRVIREAMRVYLAAPTCTLAVPIFD